MTRSNCIDSKVFQLLAINGEDRVILTFTADQPNNGLKRLHSRIYIKNSEATGVETAVDGKYVFAGLTYEGRKASKGRDIYRVNLDGPEISINTAGLQSSVLTIEAKDPVSGLVAASGKNYIGIVVGGVVPNIPSNPAAGSAPSQSTAVTTPIAPVVSQPDPPKSSATAPPASSGNSSPPSSSATNGSNPQNNNNSSSGTGSVAAGTKFW